MKLKNIFNYIPGFRSRTKFNMMIASVYYIPNLLVLIICIIRDTNVRAAGFALLAPFFFIWYCWSN